MREEFIRMVNGKAEELAAEAEKAAMEYEFHFMTVTGRTRESDGIDGRIRRL